MTNKDINKAIRYEIYKPNTIVYVKNNRIAMLVNPTVKDINDIVDRGYTIKVSRRTL